MEPQRDSDYVVVGRIGRPHGIRGELSVEPRTDEPERRFADGAVLDTRKGAHEGTLTVASTRWHQGRLLVHFEGVQDRNHAEELRGTELRTTIDPDELPDDPEEFYDHQLVDLRVEDLDGNEVGRVVGVEHNGAQDLLLIRPSTRRQAPDGAGSGSETVLFPFVQALVPEVDVAGGRIVVDDRPGLLAPEAE